MSTKSTQISTELLLEHTAYGEDEKILFLSAESIDLIDDVAAIVQAVHVYDSSHRALQRAEHYTRQENIRFHTDVFPPPEATFDAAVLFVPKGRDLARAHLWTALHALKDGCMAFIAGPNRGGAKTMIKDAGELFVETNVLGYRKSHRVASAVKGEIPDYPAAWGQVPTELQPRTFETPQGAFKVQTMPGIFSWDELDDGTRLLLEHTTFEPEQSVLDVGCGNGIIGTVAAQVSSSVVMVDDNLLAVRCAQATVDANELVNVRVISSDVYGALDDQTFDLIISNPPFHQKFDVSTNVPHKLIREARDHLNPGGRLLIVANAFLKYESLMDEYLSSVRVLEENTRFKIIEGVR